MDALTDVEEFRHLHRNVEIITNQQTQHFTYSCLALFICTAINKKLHDSQPAPLTGDVQRCYWILTTKKYTVVSMQQNCTSYILNAMVRKQKFVSNAFSSSPQ